MADVKITALTVLTAADPINDAIPIVDVSNISMAASGTTSRISINNLLSSSPTATGALTVTGLVTAGSATITGALGAAGLNVTGATIPANGVYLGSANNLSFSYASTLGMTLNATGLGVGVVPDFKFAVNGTQAVPDTTGSSTANGSLRIGAPGTGLVIDTGVTAASSVYGWIQARARTDYTSNFNLVLQPNGGNVGIGVTPSTAWNTGTNLQVGAQAALYSNSALGAVDLSSNSVRTGNDTYQYLLAASNQASRFTQRDGAFRWFSAAAGTSPNAITFGDAKMTLDASGNLILLSSNTPATLATNGQLTVNATSNTNLRFSYRGSDGTTRVANITLA